MLGYVEESAPSPHALTKSGQTNTSSPAHLPDTFPELDCELLQVRMCIDR